MAKQKPKPNDAFTSIQILSSKAQSLWSKARQKMDAKDQAGQMRSSTAAMPKPKESVRVDIPAMTVIRAAFMLLSVIAGVWILFMIRNTLLIFALAAFLSIVIDSSVRRMERWRIPRGVAVVIMYLIFISISLFLVASLIPIVANQLQDLAAFMNRSLNAFINDPEVSLRFLSPAMNEKLTEISREAVANLGLQNQTRALFQFGQNLSVAAQTSLSYAIQLTGSLFNFLVSLVLILFLTFFMQMEREKISATARGLLPLRYRGYYDDKSAVIHQKMSQWFQGQLILCLTIGVLTFIALNILGLGQYALTLALLAGFVEFIPYAGPLIAAVPAILIAVTQYGLVWALITAVVYYIIQACENNLLVPLIMKHAVGLSPMLVIFGMMVGVSFPDTIHPILGIILAVPTTTIIAIFMEDLLAMRRTKQRM